MMPLSSKDVAMLYRNMGKEPPKEFAADKKAMAKQKYGRIKKEVDGILFDSTAEAEAYKVLKMWKLAGAITDLRLQVAFTLQDRFRDSSGRTVRSLRYTADFQFFDCEARRVRVVDVKGVITPAFRKSMKMMKDSHPDVEVEIWDRQKINGLNR